MREIPVDEEEDPEDTFDVELRFNGFPLFGEEVLGVLSENRGDFVLIEAVVESFLFRHSESRIQY